MSFIFMILISISAATLPNIEVKKEQADACMVAREYITSFEYLTQQESIQLTQEQAHDVAIEVSKGCKGAAQRFVRTFELLMRMELGAETAFLTGKHMALASDEHQKTFITVFKRAYLRKHLDLDIRNSFQLAQMLSVDYNGDARLARKDFVRLTEFCLDADKMGLSLPQCAQFVSRVVRKTLVYQKPIFKAFEDIFEYLRESKDFSLTIGEALEVSESIISQGPEAVENFISLFDYARKHEKLKLTLAQAAEFAARLSQHTYKELKDKPPLRLPASIRKTRPFDKQQ